jgi:hypothetical protein
LRSNFTIDRQTRSAILVIRLSKRNEQIENSNRYYETTSKNLDQAQISGRNRTEGGVAVQLRQLAKHSVIDPFFTKKTHKHIYTEYDNERKKGILRSIWTIDKRPEEINRLEQAINTRKMQFFQNEP